ncbi:MULTISPECIES: hypothetical protein [Bradyrhizobium]|uniref:hypothetical protein n=1 Tax=Bradyrhizobium TaxID=374 RepID=UPI00155F2272|nr:MULTISPECIES: hypothetical protein [Bradyrhizobium]MDD1522123.1 hypothetical protein [Bradyrhizobium sp. WBAH30]MDD1541449.1 hypothetical protein [Bradyrhizobium sp. WBAH41]MDD1556927.1 hypothetical protein [Bradyrhizobium sp. WBAH23]MDD1564728.1 hypothetical protein [Bradyrhizobium sp. WBAH33]MDD1589719.1 hypothetical protein [Bradyrhizobium sp. WBAH42]
MTRLLLALSIAFGLLNSAYAGFVRTIPEDVAIAVELAPARKAFPAGRILKVLRKGDALKVIKAWETPEGVWLEVKLTVGDQEQTGFVSMDQTNFNEKSMASNTR